MAITFRPLRPASAAVLALALSLLGAARADGIDQASPLLPPAGVYRSPADVHATYATPIGIAQLSDIAHRPFTASATRSVDGAGNEIERFDSEATGLVSLNGLPPGTPVFGRGPVTTIVFGLAAGGGTGSFDTEMLSLDLTMNLPGGSPLMLRESPTLRSTGKTTITQNADATYHIGSFFDVFTELSIDGGQTWTPSTGSTRVVLGPIPEPMTGAMFGLGLAGLLALRAARRAAPAR